MTIKGVKNLLNSKTFELDESLNVPINVQNINFKVRLNKISRILKNIKKIK